jgi:Protein of unknown function (DUF2927)
MLGWSLLFVSVFAWLLVQHEVLSMCEAASEPNFEERLNYMTFGSEYCLKERCNDRRSIWNNTVPFSIIGMPEMKNEIRRVLPIVNKSLQVMSEISKVAFTNAVGVDPNLFIFVTNEEMIEAIQSKKTDGFDTENFKNFIVPILRAEKCAGIVTTVKDKKINRIAVATIFIPVSIVPNSDALSLCIQEEIFNAMGILRDPKGQASLFDDGNFRYVNGTKTYSFDSLAMLDVHYAIATGNYRNLSDYLSHKCKADR